MLESDFRDLTHAEVEFIRALLREPFQGRDELLQQLPGIRGKRVDEDGSIQLSATGPRATVITRVPVTGYAADVDGVTVEVLLHVVNGVMDEVEMYRHAEGNVMALPDPSTMKLITVPWEWP